MLAEIGERKGETMQIIRYLRERCRFFVIAVIWVGVFFLIFFLSGVPLRDIWYPTLVCGVLFGGYLLWDFVKYQRKHIALRQMLSHVEATLEKLPEASGLLEEDYQLLLRELFRRKNAVIDAERAEKAETMECAALWTHQLKIPLTALQMSAQEMSGPVRGELLARLFEIEQYGDMMLQYLRLEGEGADYVLQPYSVSKMVQQAVKYFARLFISKGLSVSIDLPEDAKAVTDEKWFVFALKQIISNALKYTEEGCITITMEEGKLVISDTGIGIRGEDLPRIFERGYTGYNGRWDKKATGLGLYLTGEILGRLRHEIHIVSDVGQGTRVEIGFDRGKL